MEPTNSPQALLSGVPSLGNNILTSQGGWPGRTPGMLRRLKPAFEVVGGWAGLMAGGGGLGLALAARFWTQNVISNSWMWMASLACVIITAVRSVAIANDKLAAAERKLTERRPKLILCYSARRGVDPNDYPVSGEPLFIRNDGSTSALNVSFEECRLGSDIVECSLSSAQLAPNGDTASLHLYCLRRRIDTDLFRAFTPLLENSLRNGVPELFEERIAIRVTYTDDAARRRFTDHYEIIARVRGTPEHKWQSDAIRIELIPESAPWSSAPVSVRASQHPANRP